MPARILTSHGYSHSLQSQSQFAVTVRRQIVRQVYTSSRLAFVCQVQSGWGWRGAASYCCWPFSFDGLGIFVIVSHSICQVLQRPCMPLECAAKTHTHKREGGRKERERVREGMQAHTNGGAYTVTVNDFFILYQLVIVVSPTHTHTHIHTPSPSPLAQLLLWLLLLA